MPNQIKLPEKLQRSLRCPICHSILQETGEHFVCANQGCSTHFPIINGIPIILNEKTSIFTVAEVTAGSSALPDAREKKFINAVRRFVPTISANVKAKENFSRLHDLLLKQLQAPCVLIIGGRISGEGIESIEKEPAITLIESDVALGPRTTIINDAHEIPFEDGVFDAVIIQAVLEYLVDPDQCVQEIERVLKDNGIVYAETPFMQQNHGGPYDFMRFTHLGHRRLFRKFTEIDSGLVCGPGMALAWSYQYFLLSFTTSRILRTLIKAFTTFTAFFLKYFDYYLINKPGAYDAASGVYFMGKKEGKTILDKELIKLYRGSI